MRPSNRLVVVSNRVPPSEAISPEKSRDMPVGGLVSAVKVAMQERGGLWFGWSGGSTQRRSSDQPVIKDLGGVKLATIDLSEDEVSLFYTGYANRTLWPLLHYLPSRVVIRRDLYRAYRRINRRFAEALCGLLEPGDIVWVHDFHLFHLGQELRRLGWEGKIGFFLHVPFPSADIFSILPWAAETLKSLLSYDLVGVQTERYLRNLIDSLKMELDGTHADGVFTSEGLSTRLGAYEIGIEPSIFQQAPSDQGRSPMDMMSISTAPGHKIILGVDRLDYTKGIPHRLRALERLLEHHSSLRGRVTYVQISSPSRTRVPEYIQEKEQVDRLVGHINGRFSEAGWVPIRYLYRSFPQHELAELYRDADVGMVTPLRDGMNLVAKEFVAAQRDDPGVLVLSRFSGAASSLVDAVIVNPYDIEGTAEATYRALRMGLSERKRRCSAMMATVNKHTATSWSDDFTRDLIET